jgi:hypothetical protein
MSSALATKIGVFAAGAVTALLLAGAGYWLTHRETPSTDFRQLIQDAGKLDVSPTPSPAPLPAELATPLAAADPSEPPAFTNRLSGETSPYLLMHAHNPVDWYPWGEEAFARARKEQKPILLSVGYAA